MFRCRVLWRLICVYTICLGPNYEAPGKRELINCKMFTDMTDVVRVLRSSKARLVINNVYFLCSSCILSHLDKQLFSPKLKKIFSPIFHRSLKGFGIL